MSTFSTLFRHERRSLFPAFNFKKKPDIIGGFIALVISALVIGIFLYMVSTVAKNYVVVTLNKVSDPIARSGELLTLLYLAVIIGLSLLCLEKMRTALSLKEGKDIFLRLPVSSKTMFISKLLALMLWNYVTGIFLVLPINIIFYIILKPGAEFFLNTVLVVIFLPAVSFLISTLLLVPYIGVVSFLSRHYFITLVVLSGILIGAFFAYSKFLDVVQKLFETGSIKFLFNQKFVDFLQATKKHAIPANTLADLALGEWESQSMLILIGFAVVSFVEALFITNALYKITLYRTAAGKVRCGRRHVISRSPLRALMRKEFVSVFRNPKHLFSYFSVALATPFMIYCCYTLFKTLLINAIGTSFELALTLVVMLVFGILTNTFCATNISRDGKAALKVKVFPIKPSTILFSKVLFCSIVSSLSVVASGLFLMIKADVSLKTSLVAIGVGLLFSLSQIFLSTRMDLNHARVAASPAETEKASNRTIAKVVLIGLVLAIITSFLSLFASAFAGNSPSFLGDIEIQESYSLIIPLVISVLYLIVSLVYCFANVKKAFNRLVR